MDLVVAARDAGTACGGKAAGIALLIRAELPVPDGFVLTHAAFEAVAGDLPGVDDDGAARRLAEVAARAETAAVPDEVAAAVATAIAALGSGDHGLFAVRSSVSIEDTAAGTGAGVLASRVAVPLDELWPAIRAVWASACTPVVVRYARARGVARIAIGVIVQHHVPGARVTVYTRPPGRASADEVWFERGDEPAHRLARGAIDPRVVLACAAERAIGAEATGADVELIEATTGLVIVQARRIVHPPPRVARVPPPATLLAPLVEDRARGVVWSWDVEHNPEPLSLAQAGLVATVDAAGVAPYRMCTVAGYLYVAADAGIAIDSGVRPGGAPARPGGAPALRQEFAVLEREMATALASAPTAATVAEAVRSYVAFYAVWAGKVAPMLAAARGTSTRAAGSPIARAIASAGRGDLAAADIIDQFGDLALTWDVAAPTLREQPWLIDAAIAAARSAVVTASAGSAAPRGPAHPRSTGELAVELGELDDVWFARAQAMVRAALIRAGGAMGLAGDDVFWLPLDEVMTGAIDPIAGAARAGAARAAAARARGWVMPLVAGDPNPSGGWHGIGAGPRVVGRVRRIEHGVVAPGTIVVARTITPALALLVQGAAALVSAEGGILSHGATIARELGIPFVVGCREASELVDGERLEVDGDGGTVRRLED